MDKLCELGKSATSRELVLEFTNPLERANDGFQGRCFFHLWLRDGPEKQWDIMQGKAPYHHTPETYESCDVGFFGFINLVPCLAALSVMQVH